MGLEDDPFFPFGVSVCLAFFSVVLLLNCRGVTKKTGSREKKYHHHGNLFFLVGLFQATVCFRNACEGGATCIGNPVCGRVFTQGWNRLEIYL